MAIDPQFGTGRGKIGEKDGVTVWEPINSPEGHGIHGTYVVVDFDVCLTDGACLEDCPVSVFTWVDTPGHPEFDIKAEPTHEDQRIDCMFYVDVCPVDAIDVGPG